MPRDRPRLIRFAERVTLGRAVLAILVVALVLTVAGALLERAVEPETFTSLGEAGWWAIQTVSTVGYGDVTPETGVGRLVAGGVILVGMALVPTLTSIVVAVLVSRGQQAAAERRGEDPLREIAERLDRIERRLGPDPD